MSVDILYITFNRLAYTRQTLPVMIENAGADFSLTIVDNGSSDGTVDYLKSAARSYRSVIKAIVFNKDNQGLSRVTNQFWRDSTATFVGKVDNDTLLPPDWLKTLLHAHMQSDKLGVVGGFHHRLEDVNMTRLRRRVINVDGVSLLPDAFIGGCCYIFRRSLQRAAGFLQVYSSLKTIGWTEYQIAMLHMGYYNGYLYPLMLVEHFDDPRNPECRMFAEHMATSGISMREKRVTSPESLISWYKDDVARIESGWSLLENLRPSICVERFNLSLIHTFRA